MFSEESNVILQIMGLIKISKWCMQSGDAKYKHTLIYISLITTLCCPHIW